MASANRKSTAPVELAILDGLGGLDWLEDTWKRVRTAATAHAKERTRESRERLESFLRQGACDLAEHVELLLPRSEYRELWQGNYGSRMNPVEQCVNARSSSGLQRYTQHQLEVFDQELPRLLQIADGILGRLTASRSSEPLSPQSSTSTAAPSPPATTSSVSVDSDGDKLSDIKKSAIRKYASGAVAIVELACRESGEGIGLDDLATQVGVGASHLRDNVLTPLRQGQVIEYDEVTKKWMTNTRKDALERRRAKKLAN